MAESLTPMLSALRILEGSSLGATISVGEAPQEGYIRSRRGGLDHRKL